jgi:addiction module HigA family antidote
LDFDEEARIMVPPFYFFLPANASPQLPFNVKRYALNGEYLKPLGLSMNKLALDLRVPVTRISEIVHELRGITTDTALRLARYFNTTPRFWLNLQASYDLEVAEDESSERIEQEVPPAARREFSVT